MTADPSATGSAARPAWFVEPTLGQRFFGWLLDGLIFVPVSIALRLVTGRPHLAFVVAGALRGIYEITLTARTGRTVGKIAMGTSAVDAVDARVISVSRAVVRWLVLSGVTLALSVIVFHGVSPAAPYLTIVGLTVLPAPLHRGLHDRAAGTVVTSVRTLKD
jgi:uncharacterized RDD family membrane protein YckC